jgi:Cu(I)-responsive transcriptional regulator
MKIGEVSARAGVSQRMIRHYEKIGLIAPASRRDSGYRDYSERDLHTLRFIGRARDAGFPIEEIRQLLALWNDRDRSSADVKALALARAAELKRKARELNEMRRSLEDLASRCQGDDRPDCPILGSLETTD